MLSAGSQSLRATGKQIVAAGWKRALAGGKDSGETDDEPRGQTLPQLSEGTRCHIEQVELKALKTQAPKPFTQGELVKAMKGVAKLVTDPRLKQKLKETTGIGTEATRANIIGGLLARGYIVKQGRAIRASEAAFTLIDAVPAAIADPGTTALWEQALDMIESGKLTLEAFVQQQSNWIAKLIQQYGNTTLSIKTPQGPVCPLCGAATRQRMSKTGAFWSCHRYPECKGVVAAEKSSPRPAARKRRPSRTS
jgi:DNA topoisomerase-3